MTGNYKTTYPYIETFLNAAASVPGGSALVLPTIQASVHHQLGRHHRPVINDYETEFVASTSITNGTDLGHAHPRRLPEHQLLHGLAIGCTPPYQAPSPRWTLTVTALRPPTVTSVSPTSGPAGAGPR